MSCRPGPVMNGAFFSPVLQDKESGKKFLFAVSCTNGSREKTGLVLPGGKAFDMKKKILVTGRLPDEIMTDLRRQFDVIDNKTDEPMERSSILHAIEDCDGLLCMLSDTIDEKLMERAPRLKVIAGMGVGFNHIELKAATSRGIMVSNTPGANTDAAADMAFGLMLSAARRIVEADHRTRAGEFKYWAPLLFLGRMVSGKTLGLVGMGKIGQAMVQRAKGFSMRVIYFDPRRLDPGLERTLCVEYADLRTLLETADFISLHVPLLPETRHLIGRAEFALMKKSAYLINASRGPIVDEKALVEALRNGLIAGAGIDVYENEPDLAPGLADLRNAVLTPHIGSATIESRTAMAAQAALNLKEGLGGKLLPNIVNPEVAMNRRS
jgi:glyoxylate reductase